MVIWVPTAGFGRLAQRRPRVVGEAEQGPIRKGVEHGPLVKVSSMSSIPVLYI
jgi:hypothetical protein